ncbi:hypothetical protein Bca52824_043811 [Brassica carinata]|uniref:GDSL esterase/lipase At5g55050-like n=2 Tax=Brassica TaxID=3705 RepID=A0A8X7RZW6_BRACI|nr:hypothetical protein Bca52824_043811 [Brassica carinata]
MADKLKEQLKRLHDTGARRFLIVGVAQIGCTPGQRAKNSMHECDEEANTWGSLYNEALVKMLQQLKEELGSSMTYSYFDNFNSLHDIVTNPARYAEKIGLPLPPPYLSLRGLLKWRKRESAAVTGVNFASGGAGIFDGSSQFPGQAIPLSQQMKHWLSIHKALTRKLGRSKAQIHLSKSLFVMVIGSNDLLNYIRSSQLRRKSTPQQYTQSVVDRFKAQFKTVQETGSRRFLILGVAELGCMPSRREKNSTTHECNKEANMLASLYNKALIKMLQQLKEELKSSMAYSYFDMFNSVHDIVSNPTHYGFSDVTSACCGSGVLNAELPCFPVSNLCSDRTKYLFWDRYGHPTEAAARTIVNFVLSEDTQYSSPLTLTQLVSS